MAVMTNVTRGTRLLLVDDHVPLAESLSEYFTALGYEVDFAYNGAMGLQLLSDNEYDVAVVDVAMPKMDGIAMVTTARDSLHLPLPVIFLTARDTLDDKLSGFAAGGDDYLVKPFANEELVCRIEALLSRGPRRNVARQCVNELVIDHQTGDVFYQNIPIKLHAVQRQLLSILMRHYPNVVSRQSVEQALWSGVSPDSAPLRTHLYRLRQALTEQTGKPLVQTVYGKGLQLDFN